MVKRILFIQLIYGGTQVCPPSPLTRDIGENPAGQKIKKSKVKSQKEEGKIGIEGARWISENGLTAF